MHDTALEIGRLFFETYARPSCTIVELGSLDVNGTLRNVSPEGPTYLGLDVERGPGVDAVVKANTPLPLQTDAADLVVSSSMFEHDDFFWNTFLEMLRVTKPGGAIYINSPSNGPYHRYPVDNWRFYPDSGKALQRWGRKNGYPVTLVESFIAERKKDVWNDFVAILVKGDAVDAGSIAFLSDRIACTNAWRFGQSELAFQRDAPEDTVLLERLTERDKEAEPHSSKPAAVGLSLTSHFRSWLNRKRKEARPPSLIPHVNAAFPEIAALLAESSEAAPELRKEMRSLIASYASRWPFDEKFYLRTYGDVAVAVAQGKITSPLLHFCSSGYAEGRLPIDPDVDPIWYLETYPDVADAIQNGLVDSADEHFRKDGYREGRHPSRSANPPVQND